MIVECKSQVTGEITSDVSKFSSYVNVKFKGNYEGPKSQTIQAVI